MSKNNVIELAGRDERQNPLTDRLGTGGTTNPADSRTSAGTAGVVPNGYLPERDLQTSLGSVPVKILKVRSKTGAADIPISAGYNRRQWASGRRWMHKTMSYGSLFKASE